MSVQYHRGDVDADRALHGSGRQQATMTDPLRATSSPSDAGNCTSTATSWRSLDTRTDTAATSLAHHQRSLRTAMSLVLCIALGACTVPTSEQREAIASAQPSPAPKELPVSNPKLTAEEIGQRVLKLIDGIRSSNDITPDNLEKAMGMKVEFNAENRNIYGFGDDLTDTWSFNLLTISASDGRKPTELIFSFNDQTGSAADMTAVCAMDFDDYSRALVAAGFKSSPQLGEHGILVSTNFTRGNVTVRMSVEPESEATPERACVSLMTIST